MVKLDDAIAEPLENFYFTTETYFWEQIIAFIQTVGSCKLISI